MKLLSAVGLAALRVDDELAVAEETAGYLDGRREQAAGIVAQVGSGSWRPGS